MGRGRGKGKKSTSVQKHEDPASGGEESLPVFKRRGRPQKPVKEDPDEEKTEKVEEDDGENLKAVANKDVKSVVAMDNGKKRKRHLEVKHKTDSIQEENGVGAKPSSDELIKSNGFRQNGSRRKSKPRRAAEAGVECG